MHILVIDDNSDICDLILATAQSMGIDCTATTKADDFFAALNPTITLVILDLMMPDMDGIELLRSLGQKQFTTNIILMSGIDIKVLENAKTLASSLGLSLVGVIQKPFRIAEIKQLIESSINYAAAPKQVAAKAQAFLEINKDDLIRALKNSEFVMHYQPQIAVAANKIVGFEALIRWQHPKYGLVYPDNFINKFEESGLIDELTWLMIKMSFAECKQFINADAPRTLSLNVSPLSFLDLKFPDRLEELAKQYAVDPKNILIEVTETAIFQDLNSALDILTRIRIKQFNLSIDDFGTGYAMLDQIKNVPAKELKIDKSLVYDLNKKDAAKIMLRKMIEMAHEMRMEVIAEGVETEEQLQALRDLNCDFAQGFLFSRALAVAELLLWIKNFEK